MKTFLVSTKKSTDIFSVSLVKTKVLQIFKAVLPRWSQQLKGTLTQIEK